MAIPWFCKINGQETGPFSGATLKDMVADGRVMPETEIRRGDSTRWVKAAQVQGLFGEPAAAAKPASASSSNIGLKRARSLDAPPRPPVAAAPPPVAGAHYTPPEAAAPPRPFDSQAIPTGVPVGMPVGAASIPVGQAVAPAGMHASAATDSGLLESIEARRRKKKLQQMLMVGGLVAVVLIAAVGGLLYAMWGGGAVPEVAANPDPAAPEIVLDDSAAPAADATAADAAPAEAEAEQASEVLELLAAVEADDWRDISPLRTISLRGYYKLKVTAAWLSDDPRGTTALAPGLALADAAGSQAAAIAEAAEPVGDIEEEPPAAESDANDALRNLLANSGESLPAAAPAAADEPTAASDKPGQPSRYLIVAVEVTNAGEQPLTYLGWNPAGNEDVAASLIANDKAELRAIGIQQAAGPGRSSKKVLMPGEELVDHLVFAAPTQPVESLKLILPKEAIGREGTYGFHVTGEVLAAKYEQQLAEAQKNAPPAAAVAAEPMPAEAAPAEAVAADVPAAAEPAVEEPKPLTELEKEKLARDEFLRSINGEPEDEKKDLAPEKKP